MQSFVSLIATEVCFRFTEEEPYPSASNFLPFSYLPPAVFYKIQNMPAYVGRQRENVLCSNTLLISPKTTIEFSY